MSTCWAYVQGHIGNSLEGKLSGRKVPSSMGKGGSPFPEAKMRHPPYENKTENQSETCGLLKLKAVEVKTEAKFGISGTENLDVLILEGVGAIRIFEAARPRPQWPRRSKLMPASNSAAQITPRYRFFDFFDDLGSQNRGQIRTQQHKLPTGPSFRG